MIPRSRVSASAVLVILVVFAALAAASAQESSPAPAARLPDATIVYARVDSLELKLDLHLPSTLRADSTRSPLVLWLHGGGWRGGSRGDPCPALYLLDSGYAVARVDYRLSAQARWPAPIHDAKAALRWLRGHADSLRLDTARFAAWGTSAGGQLAALLGLTSSSDGLDGNMGVDSGDASAPARIRAVVMYHAPADFLEFHPRRWKRGSSVSQLLGCAVPECPVLARRASPVAYASADDPPVFVAHGTADSTVPVTQAWRMYAALRAADVPSELAILPGADHGGPDFLSPDMMARVSAFLRRAFAGDTASSPAPAAAPR